MFDASCIVTGVFLVLFFVGLGVWRIAGQWRLTVARLLGVLGSLGLILIGVFSEDFGTLHTIVSAFFFVLLILAILATDHALARNSLFLKPIGYYGILVALCSVVYIAFYMAGRPVIILEWITVGGALLWVGLLVYDTFQMQRVPVPVAEKKIVEQHGS